MKFVRDRRALFDHAGLSNPFASSEWVLHFVAHVARDDWTFVIPEQLSVEGASLMLLYGEGATPHRLSAVTNYYASLYSPLVSSLDEGPDRTRALGALVDQLVDASPRSSAITFAPVDKQSADTRALRDSMSEHGWYVREYSCFGNWHLPCDGLAFDDYIKARNSKLHNTWTRKAKKFDGKDARVEIVSEPERTQAAVDAYERVYAKSWKQPEPYPRFVRDWAAICADNGWLRLGLAWVGDVPVAAQFWFTMNRRAYIFKLAYDEDFAKWSAGTVLSAHMFRHALDADRVVEIDYLTGDDAYKQSWMSERRERVGLIACNPRTARGLVLSARELAGEMRGRWRARAAQSQTPALVTAQQR